MALTLFVTVFDQESIKLHAPVCRASLQALRRSLQSNFINTSRPRARTWRQRALIPSTPVSGWAEPRAFLCRLKALNRFATGASRADRGELIFTLRRTDHLFHTAFSYRLKIIHPFDGRARFQSFRASVEELNVTGLLNSAVFIRHTSAN